MTAPESRRCIDIVADVMAAERAECVQLPTEVRIVRDADLAALVSDDYGQPIGNTPTEDDRPHGRNGQ